MRDEFDKYYLNRSVNNLLEDKLNEFIINYKVNGLTTDVAKIYYDFILKSYELAREEIYTRPVSKPC